MRALKDLFGSTKKRDALYAQLIEAAKNADMAKISPPICALDRDHYDDPQLPGMIATAVAHAARANLRQGCIFCITEMKARRPQQTELNNLLRPLAQRLAQQLKPGNVHDMRTLASLAQAIAEVSESSEDTNHALRLWGTAINAIVQQGFYTTASNIACNARHSSSINIVISSAYTWGELLAEYAKTEKQSALDMAKEFMHHRPKFNVSHPPELSTVPLKKVLRL